MQDMNHYKGYHFRYISASTGAFGLHVETLYANGVAHYWLQDGETLAAVDIVLTFAYDDVIQANDFLLHAEKALAFSSKYSNYIFQS